MITAVNLNPCIDKNVSIDKLEFGEVNRVNKSEERPAGKGYHVALMSHILEAKASCIGFNYEANGQVFDRVFESIKVPYEFVTVEGRVRTNYKLLDESNHVTTEINEKGGLVNQNDYNKMKKMVIDYAKNASILSLSGSVPQGIEPTVYRDLMIEIRKECDVKIAVDAEEELLAYALQAKPDLIKPNIYEIENTFGTVIKTQQDAMNAIDRLIEGGIGCVCLSMGGEGAIIANKNEKWFAHPLKVKVKGTTAAGDSMLAGVCAGIERGYTIQEQLRLGAAAATATVMHPANELGTKAEIDDLLKKVKIERI